MSFLRVVILASLLTIPFSVTAQNYGNFSGEDIYDTSEKAEPEPSDTLGGNKKERIKKPMLSYLFADSIKQRNVFSWTFSQDNNNIYLKDIDTMLYGFQKDYVFLQNEAVGAIYLGNLGGAETNIDYFKRADFKNFSFLNAYADYLKTPENAKFYNGKRPFTQLSFFMSGQSSRAEEQLRVIHAQNISPSTSFVLDYTNNGTKGMYNDQRTTDKNLSFTVAHTGKRLTIHSGYIYNMGNLEENGGMYDDRELTDTLISLPQNITMNLSDAKNEFKGNTVFFTGSYAVPFAKTDEFKTIQNVPAVFLGTSFDYTTYKKVYSDISSGVQDGYYENWYINPTMTLDSISQKELNARAFIQIQPYNREGIIGAVDGGIGYRHESYYNFQLEDYIYPSDNNVTKENSFYIFGNIGGKFSKYFNWRGTIDYTPIGYRNQDLKITGDADITAYVKGKPVILSGNIVYSISEPSYWSQNYFSNHYKWNNSFSKENETRFNATLKVPSAGFEAGFSEAIITNKVYYNNESLPSQYDDVLSVTSAYVRKDFHVGGFHFNNRVLLQKSTNEEVVPVPFLSANITYYYEFNVVKDVLRMQIGVEGYYNTTYKGLAYNPALMQFYNQTTTDVGNYPYCDAFISGKWKRLRFLVKMQHFNNELFGGRNYISVAHYPLNRSMFKMGVSWNFYD
ncbi:MAG: putative porin [Rikenellaceae bacterium]